MSIDVEEEYLFVITDNLSIDYYYYCKILSRSMLVDTFNLALRHGHDLPRRTMPRAPTEAELSALNLVHSIPPPTLLNRLLPSVSEPPLPLTSLTPLLLPDAHPLAHSALLSLTAHPSYRFLTPKVAAIISQTPPHHLIATLSLLPSARSAPPALPATLVALTRTPHAFPTPSLTALATLALQIYASDPATASSLPLPTANTPSLPHLALLLAAAPTNRHFASSAADALVSLISDNPTVAASLLTPPAAKCVAPLLPRSARAALAGACVSRAVNGHRGAGALQDTLMASKAAAALEARLAVRALHARATEGGWSAQERVQMLVAVVAAVGEVCERGSNGGGYHGSRVVFALDGEDALLALDAMALLGMVAVVGGERLPRKEVVWIATVIAEDGNVLQRLATLAAATINPLLAGGETRAVMLLQVLAMAFGLKAAGSREGKRRPRAGSNRNKTGYEWASVAKMLMSFGDLDGQGVTRGPVTSLARHVLVQMLAACVMEESDAVSIALALWDAMLAAYAGAAGEATSATDLARVLDVLVGGCLPCRASVACVQQLELAAASWRGNVERARVAKVLLLRAALRCELAVLAEVLAVAARVVASVDGEAVVVAREAVLHADAVRKGVMLQWYYELVSGCSGKADSGGPRRAAGEVDLRPVAKL